MERIHPFAMRRSKAANGPAIKLWDRARFQLHDLQSLLASGAWRSVGSRPRPAGAAWVRRLLSARATDPLRLHGSGWLESSREKAGSRFLRAETLSYFFFLLLIGITFFL